MSAANTLSLACLLVTGGIAAWGVFSPHFDDNLIQRLGLSIVATGCAARAFERITQDVPEPPPALLWSQVGLALYALGTVYRFWRQSHRQPNRRHNPSRRGDMLW